MEPVLLGAALFVVLAGVAIAFAWQERRALVGDAVVYGVEDALDFVTSGLSPPTRAALTDADVRRILEWELRYLQDPALRAGEVAVVGGNEAADYAQRQAHARGHPYDPAMIIEVLELQASYLETLGAVGDPVDADEGGEIIARYEIPAGGEERA